MATASLPSASMELPVSETSSFMYATQYSFLPLGVEKVQEVFRKSLAEESLQGAQCDYERTRGTFLVTCTSVEFDAVINLFNKIIKQIIDEEVGYDDGYGDEIDSKLVARVHLDPDLDEIHEQVGAYIAGRSKSSDALVSWDEWHCQSENQIMDTIIPKAVLEQIEDLTGTKLVENLKSKIIRVGSQSKEARERALHKLDVFRKTFDIAQRTGAHHLFYGEERENFQVSLKQIVQIPRRFAETTLLDPFRNQNYVVQGREMQKICTIHFCYFDPDRTTYLLKAGAEVLPLIQEKDKDIVFEPWKDYTYPAMGTKPLAQVKEFALIDITDDETQIPPFELKERQEKVKKWLDDDAVPDPVEQVDLLKIEEGNIDRELKDREERARKWLADDDLLVSINPEEREKLGPLHLASQMIDHHLVNSSTPLNTPELLAFDDPCDEDLYPFFNLTDPLPMHSHGHSVGDINLQRHFQAPQTSDTKISDDPRHMRNPNSLHPSLKSVVISTSTVDNRNIISNRTDSILLEDFRSAAQTNITSCQQVATNFEVKQPENAADNIICCQVPHNATGILEATETNHEFDSRNYNNTAWLRVSERGKRKVSWGKSNLNPTTPPFRLEARKAVIQEPADPTEDFTKATNEKIKLLLTSMRVWRGEVFLEAQFGRVIIRNLADNVVAWGSNEVSHTLQDMDWILSLHPNSTDFTRILTSLGADAQWIVSLKSDSNEPMWKNAPKCSVTYEFECYDEDSSNWFMVEIDAATSETKVKSLPKEIGTVWVHCTMKNWDYRLAAIGSQDLEEEYGHIASEIAENIYISPNLKKAVMQFQIGASHNIIFNFVRVLRTTLYPSTGNGSQLKITEVHDLKFEINSKTNAYHAFEGESTMEEGRATMWYQISLTSPIAERVLGENGNLELGEESTWSEDTFDERVHVFRSLCLPACHMVKNMDGMGFYNDNGYTAPPPAAPAPSTVAQSVISVATRRGDLFIPPDHPDQW